MGSTVRHRYSDSRFSAAQRVLSDEEPNPSHSPPRPISTGASLVKAYLRQYRFADAVPSPRSPLFKSVRPSLPPFISRVLAPSKYPSCPLAPSRQPSPLTFRYRPPAYRLKWNSVSNGTWSDEKRGEGKAVCS